MTIQSKEEAEAFSRVKIKKKIGFFYEQTDYDCILSFPEWQKNAYYDYGGNFPSYINRRMSNYQGGINSLPINWINFLLGKKNFLREERYVR